MATVSVYILCYNHADFIQQRIDTVLQQTYAGFEVHIWDDASTDGSKDIIERYSNHPKVKSICYNDTNSGSGYLQWKKAIEGCATPYIWIAEGDDFAHQDFLAKTVAVLEANDHLGLVEVNARRVVDDKEESTTAATKAVAFKDNRWDEDFQLGGEQFILDCLLYGCAIVNVSAVVFRTKAIKDNTEGLSVYRFTADWQLYIDICKAWDIAYLKAPLSYFRIHTESAIYKHKRSLQFYKENFLVATHSFYFYKKKLNKRARSYCRKNQVFFSPFGLALRDKVKFVFFMWQHHFKLSITGLFFAVAHRVGWKV